MFVEHNRADHGEPHARPLSFDRMPWSSAGSADVAVFKE
jgi:hypothetical protein